MAWTRSLHVLALAVVAVLFALSDKGAARQSPAQSTATSTARQGATATDVVPNCAITTPMAEATGSTATQSTAIPTVQATVEAIQAADRLLHFISFAPTDIKFNPNPEQPVVVVIVYSLVFQNELDQELQLERPRFRLSIDGVSWSDVASTDFQTGRLRAHGTQGIVLQTLTILARATDAQKAVLNCIKDGHPIDLYLTGTIDASVDTTQQTVNVALLARQVVIRARKP